MSDARAALEAIGTLPDAEIDIGAAAIQLARVDAPDADWHAATAHLSELARSIAARAASSGPAPAERGATLTALLAGQHGYRGDTASYDDLANANLIRVTERRMGLPVALGVLWLHCARAVDWPAHGIDFPGHFLIGITGAGSQAVLDVFAGGEPIDARGLRGLIKAVEGPEAELRPGLMRPMSARGVLLRLQNNIKMRRLRGQDLAGALACTEDMLRIAPGEATLWREAALMNQRLDRVAAALRCFDRFVALVPDGEAATRARAAMEELRTRLH